ncbi:MAG: hypothetical protein IJ828_11665, partial [Treponema sp.]|nr:hypothetical protein [Treponema sp.]
RPVCKFNFAQVQGFLAFLHFFLAPVEPFFALIFFVCMILDSFSVDTTYVLKYLWNPLKTLGFRNYLIEMPNLFEV